MNDDVKGRQSDGVTTIDYPAAVAVDLQRLSDRAALLLAEIRQFALDFDRAERRMDASGVQVPDDSWSGFCELVGAAPVRAALGEMVDTLAAVL